MKVHYDKDEDILMIVLSQKKVDDSFETENAVVSVDKNGEPVMLDIMNASQFLQDLGRVIPKKIQQEVWTPNSIPALHQIRK